MKIEVEAVEELLNKSKSDIFPEDYLGEIDIEEGSEEEEFIQLIAESGRKFFNHQDREGCCISHFTLKAGRTYFVDGYTKSEIYAYENHYFGNRFTEGGTMQALVLDIAEWIRTGEPTNAKNGYGGIYCDHWGYPPKAMAAIQRKAKEIGFTAGLEADLDRRGYIVEQFRDPRQQMKKGAWELPKILDACCGSRMFWFDKENPDVTFMDCRQYYEELPTGHVVNVNPDVVGDFRDMPFEDNEFDMVVFDPPHLIHAGENSWLAKKYGRLDELWPEDIRQGFAECMRVLRPAAKVNSNSQLYKQAGNSVTVPVIYEIAKNLELL